MEYKDNINTLNALKENCASQRSEVIEAARRQIATDEQLTTVLYQGCKGCYDRINNIKRCSDYHESVAAQDTVKILELNTEIYRFYGCLVINEMEFYAAIINLLRATTNWEYNVSARRAFTLICEIKNNVSNLFGNKRWPLLTQSLNKEEKDKLGEVKSRIENFHNKDKIGALIDNIRNKTEAHKDDDFMLQVELIESITIEESWEVINEFSIVLNLLIFNVKFIINALESDIKSFVEKYPGV